MDSRYNSDYLYFDEPTHKYTDSLGNSYISVTTMIHDNYTPKFDKKYWLRKKSRELGISSKELERQWQAITDEACSRGTATHNGIEDAIKETANNEVLTGLVIIDAYSPRNKASNEPI